TERPLPGERIFDPAAGRPAGPGIRISRRAGGHARPRFRVGVLESADRQASGAVDQPIVGGKAEPRPHGADPVLLGAEAGEIPENVVQRDGRRVGPVAPGEIAFDPHDERAQLPVVADLPATDEAVRVEGGAGYWQSTKSIVEVCAPPGITGVA